MELPSPDSSRTSPWRLEAAWAWNPQELGLEGSNKRAERREAQGKLNPIARARIYKAAMVEEGATLRTVAERFRVTRQEVCQYLAIIRRLPPELIEQLEAVPVGQQAYSMRRLLSLARAARPGRPAGPYGIAEGENC